MMKRLLSLLLVVIMLLGVLPASVFAAEVETTNEAAEEVTLDPIEIDFKDFAKKASKQDWWDALPSVTTTDGYETKRIGTAFRGTIPAEEK